MSDEIKIMTDEELTLLGQRRRANKDTLVDPVIFDRLYATVMHYRDGAAFAADRIRQANCEDS